MNLHPELATELALWLDRLEHGAPLDDLPNALRPTDVADLVGLAQRLRTMPEIRPSSIWMSDSKQRLMDRFDCAPSAESAKRTASARSAPHA